MKIFLWVFISLVVIVGVAFGIKTWIAHNSAATNTDTIVHVEPAAVGDLTESVSAPGNIEAKTKVSISARVAARIIALPYKEGDTVTGGNANANPPVAPSVLVKLDATDLEAQLHSAQAHYSGQEAQLRVGQSNIVSQKAQIESSQIQLADAERDLKRQQQLLGSKDVSQSVVDDAQAKVDQLKASLESAKALLKGAEENLDVLRFELEAAEAEIARSKDNLSYTMITSPINGIVTRVNAQVGELVVTGTMNNPGTVIMEVADLSRMILKARVDESSIADVKVGQTAIVRVPAYQDKEFHGIVSTVALADTTDALLGNQRYFKTEISLDTAGQRLISGLNADAEIETASYHHVITVPSQAVVGRPVDFLPPAVRDAPEVDHHKTSQLVVFRLVNGKAVITPVRVGASDVTRTVIESGLKENDPIITGPYKVLDALTADQVVHSDGLTPAPPPTTTSTTGPTTNSTTSPATTQANK